MTLSIRYSGFYDFIELWDHYYPDQAGQANCWPDKEPTRIWLVQENGEDILTGSWSNDRVREVAELGQIEYEANGPLLIWTTPMLRFNDINADAETVFERWKASRIYGMVPPV